MTVKRNPKGEGRPAALVTGASTGIGAAFARKLASLGYDVILVAKRGEEGLLEGISAELSGNHGVLTECIAADFSDYDDVTQVVEKIKRTSNLTVLVNSAGFGGPGLFLERDVDIHLNMIKVHNIAIVRLTHAAIPVMLTCAKRTQTPERFGTCAIINVSSATAFLAYIPSLVYNATKVFLNSFSESLAFELRNTCIRVQALCPGFTRTCWYTKLGYSDDHPIFTKRKFMSAEEVVRCSIKCLKKNKVVCIPGWHNRFFAVIFSLMPRRMFYWGYSRFQKGRGSDMKGFDAKID